MASYKIPHDDELLFKETHYARYGNERTNIYGLAVFQSRLMTFLDRPDEFPSHRYESPPKASLSEQQGILGQSVRHFMTVSAAELSVFVSRDGYWNSLCIPVGLEAGKSQVIAMDVFEEHTDTMRFVVALAVSQVRKKERKRGVCGPIVMD
ncbi:hypothetical protein BDF14DRAFT_1725381 [Spinellus fusiger]|nr:hypothetical protein BDF14DRAFT_1725381 [Spinellus fusiger]